MDDNIESSVSNTRSLTGVVVSTKGDKTVSVRIERRVKHARYGKFIRCSKKYAAHDEANVCHEGDEVEIRECRPISKTKSWVVSRIVRSVPVE